MSKSTIANRKTGYSEEKRAVRNILIFAAFKFVIFYAINRSVKSAMNDNN